MRPVTRQKLNIVIDMIMLVVMVVLAVIGFLIRYKLLSGVARWEKFGQNVDMTFLGFDRHQWGYVHLITGISLVFLLVLHIILHWGQLVCMIKRLLPESPVRTIVPASLILVSFSVVVIPFIVPPEIGEPVRRQGEGYGSGSFGEEEELSTRPVSEIQDLMLQKNDVQKTIAEESLKQPHSKGAPLLEIKGFQTIADIEETFNIPAGELKNCLKIPATVSNNERLGRIRRLYGFTMREVEDCILELQSKR